MTIETPDLIDALPYIDTAIEEDELLRELVLKLVGEEMREFNQTHNQDIALPDRPFLTERLRNQLIRIEKNQPLDELKGLSTIQTDIPPSTGADIGENELLIWRRCLDQMKIKLEYRQRQLSNLELMKTYGGSVWEQYLTKSEQMRDKLDQELQLLGSRIKNINAERRTNQEQISRHLDVLQSNWENLSIRNQMLSEEIYRLKNEVSTRT